MPPNHKAMLMRRVRTVYLARQIIKPFAMQLIGLVISMIGLLSLVSITSVVKNIMTLPSVSYALRYVAEAFLHTQTLVEVMAVTSLGLSLLVFRNLLKRYLTVSVPFIPMAR